MMTFSARWWGVATKQTREELWCFRRGKMPASDIIVIGQSLITHGIIGKAKIRKPQRHESNSYVNEFNAFEYISAARNHFSMPHAEAESAFL